MSSGREHKKVAASQIKMLKMRLTSAFTRRRTRTELLEVELITKLHRMNHPYHKGSGIAM